MLTANCEYSHRIGRIYGYRFKCIYLKKKFFCLFFIAFLNSILNFEKKKKKNEPHSLRFSEVIDVERRAYLNM